MKPATVDFNLIESITVQYLRNKTNLMNIRKFIPKWNDSLKQKYCLLILFYCLSVSASLLHAQNTKILSGLCKQDILKEKLLDIDSFKPVPAYGDSYWKDSIPEVMRLSYIREAEKYLNTRWESINLVYFSDFKENGDRNRYQDFIFSKRDKLLALAMGEIMEGKGRFMNDILNGLFSVCEETWWGIPAHYNAKVPQPELQTLALFSGETGGMMSWLYYMFKDPIRRFSPLLEQRILSEISRRVLQETLNRKEWWRTASMNWNPWICSNWMACVLFAEPDNEKRVQYMRLILESLDAFIDGYPDDGGCDEGANYWDRAAGSLYDCLILLRKATGGYVDLSHNTKVRLMGDYLCKMNIGNGYFVNFADAAPQLTPHVDWYPYGLYFNNKELLSMTAQTASEKNYFENPAAVYTSVYLYLLNRELTLLSHLSSLKASEGENVLLFDSWLPRIQVLTARSVRNSTEGLFLATKGGHNAESHNHNDVGSFIVYADGQPLFIDPGVGTYRKETFDNSTRYKIWSMQSGYHNLPQINGTDQMQGRQFAASDVRADIGRRSVVFRLDLAKAYPEAAKVRKWIRTVDFTRNKRISVTEEYQLSERTGESTLMFMSKVKPEIKDGVVEYTVNGKTYGLYYDTKDLEASYEKLRLEDKKFVDMWGELYRLKLRIKSASLTGTVKYTIKKL